MDRSNLHDAKDRLSLINFIFKVKIMLKNSLLNLYHPSILLQKIANFSSSKKQQKNLSLIFFTYFRFVKINHKNNFQKTFSSSGLDLIHFFFCFFKHMLMGEGVGG